MEKQKSPDLHVAEPIGVYIAKAGQQWQLQEAKARFSEVFKKAYSDGPQIISRQGKDAVVVIPLSVFEQLTGRRKQDSIAKFFAKSPLASIALDLKRDKDTGRNIRI
jgi:antitoxin Phd